MSVELEYNGERYMVDGGKWYRRLKVGEVVMDDSEVSTITMPIWRETQLTPTKVLNNPSMHYRVPCVDPRPPFRVGDRVKVARKDESWPDWDGSFDALIVSGRAYGKVAMLGTVSDVPSYIHVELSYCQGGTGYPPWCLDLIEPAKPTVGQTIIERLTKHVEKTEQETAMKFSQWQLRPVKEPKTLADVESSREKPVLCWTIGGSIIHQMYLQNGQAVIIKSDGSVKHGFTGSAIPANFKLYQPSTPAYTLETLPDYRVVLCDEALYFHKGDQWFFHSGSTDDYFGFGARPTATDFTLTPYEAYLAEVDLTGGAK